MNKIENRYAIVGMGCVFPDADNIKEFWNNIKSGRVSIKEVEENIFDSSIFYKPEMYGKINKQDKTYTRVGAEIKNVNFDGRDFWIPPAVAKHMDDNQKVILLSAKQALSEGQLDTINKEKVGVVIGSSGYGDLYHDFQRRFTFEKFTKSLIHNKNFSNALSSSQQEEVIEELRTSSLKDTFGITEDSAPGMLPSITATRLANIFDFHGPAHTIDAACASGLAAIISGIQYLKNRKIDALICGASDMAMAEAGYIYFSGINALSPDGSFPFDERANGFVIGQGAGVVVIKRLSDAILSKDKIHAVITGYGYINDGKGKAIAAPNSDWQAKVITEACKMSAYSVDSVEMIEAHGTATKVGDLSEVSALKKSFQALGSERKNFCGLTSVKSNIGHLKSAAGIAGFIKAVLALENKVLPPIGGFKSENKNLELTDSPFYTINKAKPWERSDHPRRAGINSFGFGGINYHIALEEYKKEYYPENSKLNSLISDYKSLNDISYIEKTGPTMEKRQLLLISAKNAHSFQKELSSLKDQLHEKNVYKISEEYFNKADASLKYRASFHLSSIEELQNKLNLLNKFITGQVHKIQLKQKGVFYSENKALDSSQLVFMFPGQGSQYPNMLLDMKEKYTVIKDAFFQADNYYKKNHGTCVSDLITMGTKSKEEAVHFLKQTENTHPVIFSSNYALLQLVINLGIEPNYLIGHSAGEISALTAAGCLSFYKGLHLMTQRAKAFVDNESLSGGAMAAVSLPEKEIQAILNKEKFTLYYANINSPSQIILSGEESEISRFISHCESHKIQAKQLAVGQAFHSPLVSQAEKQFQKVLKKTSFKPPQFKVIQNETGQFYSSQNKKIVQALGSQICGTVNFKKSIEKLYKQGARLFLEIGPGSVLSSITKSILDHKDCLILSIDNKKKDSVESFENFLSQLFTAGLNIESLPLENDNPKNQNFASSMLREPENQNPKPVKMRIVYSGVSIGLPGSYKECFQENNFQQLFNGQNCIERLTDKDRQDLVDLNITKLIKSDHGATYQQLTSLDEVIQLAGKLGKIDMSDYHLDPKDISNMSSAVSAAVAVGFEALKDAHIPLIREYTRTKSGSLLPLRWSLPQEMQKETGVIFANGFPMVDPIIREVSRHLAAKYSKIKKDDVLIFYETIIENVSDQETRKKLSHWYLENNRDLINYTKNNTSEETFYQFNHQLMSQIASQANNRLAQYLNAQGPNFLLSAACSSTATAITLAEDLIQNGRVKRMIVVGADDTGNPNVLPYIGAGFLSTGACTNEEDLYEAAVPFDRRRNGMIMGSGAVGIIIESLDEVKKRSVIPVAELMGTHCFNVAGHQSQLDIDIYADQLDVFIKKIEKEKKLSRKELASKLMYMSHETYTPARGGCSQSEAVSLEHVFGQDYRNIEISNTKGMTGHTMGASLEDAVAAKSLQFAKIPPVVNHKEYDPELKGLKLSKGGSHECEYALRMAAGFGAQGNFILIKKMAHLDSRISNNEKYTQWLKRISQLEEPQLIMRKKVLSIKDTQAGTLEVIRPRIPCRQKNQVHTDQRKASIIEDKGKKIDSSPIQRKTQHDQTSPKELDQVMDVISEITGYSKDILDVSMELEADLGIDTVKQATILSQLGEQMGQDQDNQTIKISDFRTIHDLIKLFGALSAPGVPAEKGSINQGSDMKINPHVKKSILSVISEITGYDTSILNMDMELEADLGVDTVKQASILSVIGEKLGFSSENTNINLSDFSTIGDLIQFFNRADQTSPSEDDHEIISKDRKELSDNGNKKQQGLIESRRNQYDIVTDVISSNSDYMPEMILNELYLNEDFGFSENILMIFQQKICEKLKFFSDWYIEQHWTIGELKQRVQSLVIEKRNKEGWYSELKDFPVSRSILTFIDKPPINSSLDLKPFHLLIIGEDETQVNNAKSYLKKSFGSSDILILNYEKDISLFLNEIKVETPMIILDLFFSPEDNPNASLEEAHKQIKDSSNRRYRIIRQLNKMEIEIKKILLCLKMNGHYGLSHLEEDQMYWDPLSGFLSGFYKSLAKEWRHTDISILDLGGNIPELETEYMESILRELKEKNNGREICYHKGKRQALVVEDSSFNHQSIRQILDFSYEDKILVTGGASGITREILLTLSQRFQTNFIVLGKTKLLENTHELAQMNREELENYKKALYQKLNKNFDRVTPLMLEKEFSKVKKSIQIHELLKEVKALGSGIVYYSLDIRDSTETQKVLQDVQSPSNPITALIHGAGIEISHLIEKKSPEEFFNVYSVKVLGALNLVSLLDISRIKIALMLSSISGRFGNAAQIDYSAANEYLSCLARYLNQKKSIKALSLLFSGWDETGMAFENTFVREHSALQGIHLMNPKAASTAALWEISLPGRESDVIIHRGLGEMRDKNSSHIDFYHLPFIDRFEKEKEFLSSSHRVFSPKRDEFLNQHRLGETPLMPGVAYMEMMAEHLFALTAKKGPLIFKDLHFLQALKFYKENSRELSLFIKPWENGYFEMLIKSPAPGLMNKKKTPIEYARTKIKLLSEKDSVIPNPINLKEPCKQISMSKTLASGSSFKQNVIFGALFNDSKREASSIKKDTIKYNDKGCLINYPFPEEQISNKAYPLERLILNPCFLDSLHQAGAIMSILLTDQVYLPVGADEFMILETSKSAGNYMISVKINKMKKDHILYDIILLNPEQKVCCYIKNSEFHRIHQ